MKKTYFLNANEIVFAAENINLLIDNWNSFLNSHNEQNINN